MFQKCMRDMPAEAINECNKALEDKAEIDFSGVKMI